MRTALVLLICGSLFQSTQAPAVDWPPAGVYRISDVTTRPEVTAKVAPKYTGPAIRARIEGFVTLECVVEPDGSVGPVRVTRSLDTVNGLDDAAIAALKQWTFKPGTRDGSPVRVLATVMLTFGIGGPAPMSLPVGFAPWPANSMDGWVRGTASSGNLTVESAYPDSWTRIDSPKSLMAVVDINSFRSVGILQPRPLPGPFPFPMTVAQLGQFSETMRQQMAHAPANADVVAVGQSNFGHANWVWLELDAAALDPSTVPPEAAAVVQTIDRVHLWSFHTTAGSSLVTVLCGAPQFKGSTAAEREASLAAAREDCAGVIKRTSVSVR
jgi:TonB family protein